MAQSAKFFTSQAWITECQSPEPMWKNGCGSMGLEFLHWQDGRDRQAKGSLLLTDALACLYGQVLGQSEPLIQIKCGGMTSEFVLWTLHTCYACIHPHINTNACICACTHTETERDRERPNTRFLRHSQRMPKTLTTTYSHRFFYGQSTHCYQTWDSNSEQLMMFEPCSEPGMKLHRYPNLQSCFSKLPPVSINVLFLGLGDK